MEANLFIREVVLLPFQQLLGPVGFGSHKLVLFKVALL